MKIIKLSVLFLLAINVPAISQTSGASGNNWVITGGGGAQSNGAQLTVGGGTSSTGGNVNISTGGGSSGIGSITLLTPNQTGCAGLINLIVPNGSVRIGPSTSSYPLTISAGGNLSTTGAISAKSLTITNAVSAGSYTTSGSVTAGSITTTGTTTTASLSVTNSIGIGTAPRTDYTLAILGNVGVKGKLDVTKMEVKALSWSDFVFDKNYKLLGLTELETYINANKKLPDIPAAKDIVNKSFDVAAMNALLLQKIEEQSLYIIQLNKRVAELEGKLNR